MDPVRVIADELVGPPIFGAFLTCILFGILVTQFVAYWNAKRQAEDHIVVRGMVAWTMLLQTFHVCATMYYAYTHAVLGFGNVNYQFVPNIVGTVIIIDLGLSGGTMQAFFGWRVYRVTRSLPLYVFILLLVLAELVLVFYIGIWGAVLTSIAEYGRFSNLVVAYQVISPVNDLIVSLTLVLVLRSQRTGATATDSILNKISLFAIQTGLLTALWSIAGLIVYMTHQATLTSWILQWPLTTVYGVCLIASLNARENWRKNRVIQFSDLLSHKHNPSPGVSVAKSTHTQQESDLHLESMGSSATATKGSISHPDGTVHFPAMNTARDLSTHHPFDNDSD